jgi:hypothetical protein
MAYMLDADWVINGLTGRKRADTLLQQLAPTGITMKPSQNSLSKADPELGP